MMTANEWIRSGAPVLQIHKARQIFRPSHFRKLSTIRYIEFLVTFAVTMEELEFLENAFNFPEWEKWLKDYRFARDHESDFLSQVAGRRVSGLPTKRTNAYRRNPRIWGRRSS
jgi:hypothetical protein